MAWLGGWDGAGMKGGMGGGEVARMDFSPFPERLSSFIILDVILYNCLIVWEVLTLFFFIASSQISCLTILDILYIVLHQFGFYISFI